MSFDCKGNWLAEIKKMETETISDGKTLRTYIHLYPLHGLTVEKAQAAVDAMFGKGYAHLHDHGTVIWGDHLHNISRNRAAKEKK